MECSLSRTLPEGAMDAHFNKSDFLKIGEYMSFIASERFHVTTQPDIDFSYSQGRCSTTYNADEFSKNFSKSTNFTELSITVFIPRSSSYISFYTCYSDTNETRFMIHSHIHTQAELEDILDELAEFVESLPYLPAQKSSANFPKTELSSMEKYNTEPDKFQEQAIPNSSTPSNTEISPPASANPFYKSGVFWTAASVIVAAIIGILQILC